MLAGQSFIQPRNTHSVYLFTTISRGIFQLCLWPLKAPGYLGEDSHECFYSTLLNSGTYAVIIIILGSQLSPSSINLPFGTGVSWGGNRRSGVALAMRHRHHGLSTYGLNGQRRRWAPHAYVPSHFGAWHYLPLSFIHKLSWVSKSLTAVLGMQHLTHGTNFLHLFTFLVSRPPQSALFHRLALLLNRWLACLTGSSILVLKHLFSRSFPP